MVFIYSLFPPTKHFPYAFFKRKRRVKDHSKEQNPGELPSRHQPFTSFTLWGIGTETIASEHINQSQFIKE